MERLKVWFLADRHFGPHGGTEKQILMLIRALCDLGHDVRFYVLRHTPYSRVTTDFPCPIEALDVESMRSWGAVRRMWGFRRLVRRDRPDIVHAFFNDAAILAPLFGRTRRTAVLTSRRDMGFWYDSPTLAMLRLANMRANLVICNAQAVAREVQKKERLPDSHLKVIHNGMEDLQATCNDDKEREVTDRADVPRAADGIRICLLANIRRIKRIEDFLEAAARLRDTCPNCQFQVIGHPNEPVYQNELQSLAVRLSIGDRLQFTGMLANPIEVLRTCHIGVLTSESEGLSNTILEYMRAGLPVVCSNTGGNPELVAHGHNGLLYATGDIAQLAACLDRLCRDSALRRSMGSAAARAAERFSVKAMIDAHLQVYSQLRVEK
jgi:glycosyltransferase involved in cell wall biosynthesis